MPSLTIGLSYNFFLKITDPFSVPSGIMNSVQTDPSDRYFNIENPLLCAAKSAFFDFRAMYNPSPPPPLMMWDILSNSLYCKLCSCPDAYTIGLYCDNKTVSCSLKDFIIWIDQILNIAQVFSVTCINKTRERNIKIFIFVK